MTHASRAESASNLNRCRPTSRRVTGAPRVSLACSDADVGLRSRSEPSNHYSPVDGSSTSGPVVRCIRKQTLKDWPS